MRRTKIVATIGPATSEPDALKALLHAGVDVVRLNAAHASPEVHAEHAATARAAAAALDRTVGVLVDLPGPKLRTGPVVNDEVELRIDALAGHLIIRQVIDSLFEIYFGNDRHSRD